MAVKLALSGLSVPFVGGQLLEMGDQLTGGDFTGERAIASSGIRSRIGMAGAMGAMEGSERVKEDDLAILLRAVSGKTKPFAPSAGGNPDSQFLNELFASQGNRLAGIGQQAEQMSYLDMAARAGVM